MDLNFEGKRVLITGAGKGIGRDIAHAMSEYGATVVAISRTQSDLDSLKDEIGCEIIVADLSDAEAAHEAAESAGDIDMLVNNAGVALLEPFLETTVEAFDRTMAVNMRSVLVISQVIAKNMITRGVKGTIVNISSQASARALENHTSYCVSKGGLDQLTRMMALELGEYGIRVNSVNPTVVLTPMGERVWGDPVKSAPMMARIPLKKFAVPRDVTHLVAYLLSDDSDMVHGAIIPLDGGFWTN